MYHYSYEDWQKEDLAEIIKLKDDLDWINTALGKHPFNKGIKETLDSIKSDILFELERLKGEYKQSHAHIKQPAQPS